MQKYVRHSVGAAATLAAVAALAVPALALSVTVNGQSVSFQPAPIERAGRVFVPLRGVFERLGASVVYANGTINAQGNGHAISLRIGSTQATIDGQSKFVDVAPFVVGASTYVPLRFVSQALGAGVNFDSSNQIVALTTSGGSQGGNGTPAPNPAAANLLKTLEPARGATVGASRPTVQATFRQAVDPNSLRLTLDGLDITNASTRSETGFIYAPPSPLQSTSHTVTVVGKTRSGQDFSNMWRFTSGGQSGAAAGLNLTTPVEGATVSGSFLVSGTAAPNAKVHIVAGATASLGGVFSFGTGTYTTDTVAGSDGRFSQQVTLSGTPGGTIGLTVTSTDPVSKESAERKLRLRSQ